VLAWVSPSAFGQVVNEERGESISGQGPPARRDGQTTRTQGTVSPGSRTGRT